jgi:hypothetical protein
MMCGFWHTPCHNRSVSRQNDLVRKEITCIVANQAVIVTKKALIEIPGLKEIPMQLFRFYVVFNTEITIKKIE